VPYSTAFFTGQAGSSLEVIYTVPAGYVAVMRDIEYFASSAITDPVYLVSSIPGPLAAVFGYVGTLEASTGKQWQGRVVVPTGGAIELAGYGTQLFVLLSGYLLSSP
jgi:hypothetical protein